MEHLIAIQKELKVPKGQYNSFGNYRYRSCEDILEAVKPLCHKNGCVLTLSDKPVVVGEWHYIEATATLRTPSGEISVTASARESGSKKGMDESQITGTASSYARKYALNGLFNIDDTKDTDTDEYHKQERATGKKQQAPEKEGLPKEELVGIIVDLCGRKRKDASWICQRTGVDELEDMTEAQLSRWADWLEKQ